MLAALRTPAAEPDVGDEDVTRKHIDVDVGLVTALAVEPDRPGAVLAHVRQVHRRPLIFRRQRLPLTAIPGRPHLLIKANADHAPLPPDDGDSYRRRAGDQELEAFRNGQRVDHLQACTGIRKIFYHAINDAAAGKDSRRPLESAPSRCPSVVITGCHPSLF